MFIGNDVICLNLWNSSFQKANYERYITKVLNKSEYKILDYSDDLIYSLAILWSCKESIFKILMKQNKVKAFNPKAIEVDFEYNINQKNAIILANSKAFGQSYYSEINITSNFIHTISFTDNKADFVSNIIENNLTFQANSDLSNELLKDISTQYTYDINFTELKKDKFNIPYILYKNKRTNIDVSLSHDGKYFSYAFLKNQSL